MNNTDKWSLLIMAIRQVVIAAIAFGFFAWAYNNKMSREDTFMYTTMALSILGVDVAKHFGQMKIEGRPIVKSRRTRTKPAPKKKPE